MKPVVSSSSAHSMRSKPPTINGPPTALAARRGRVPPSESVYNWRFADNQSIRAPSQNNTRDGGENTSYYDELHQEPLQYHRVEYLPCDGICADEPVLDPRESDSGRSTSSRTSRGCNTEETRMISDNALFSSRVLTGDGDKVHFDELDSKTLPSNDCSFENRQGRNLSYGDITVGTTRENNNNVVSSMESLKINGSQHNNLAVQVGNRETHNYKNMGQHFKSTGIGGDLPHNLGSVPK